MSSDNGTEQGRPSIVDILRHDAPKRPGQRVYAVIPNALYRNLLKEATEAVDGVVVVAGMTIIRNRCMKPDRKHFYTLEPQPVGERW